MIGRDWLYRWDGPELAPEVAIMTAKMILLGCGFHGCARIAHVDDTNRVAETGCAWRIVFYYALFGFRKYTVPKIS